MERQEFWLEIIRGKNRGQVYRLLADAITIGRRLAAKERKINWILLDEPSLSRIHAQLLWDSDDSTYRLVHKSRTKPTLVNNREIDEEFMATQDKIQMGDVLFRFWEGPIEKKFDYFEEEFEQDQPSSKSQGKHPVSPLPPQKSEGGIPSPEGDAQLPGESSPVRKGSAPARQHTLPVAGAPLQPERDTLRKAGAVSGSFKPVDLFASAQGKEQAPPQEEEKKPRVFYSQKDELKRESARFRPLKFDLLSSSDSSDEHQDDDKKGLSSVSSLPRRVDIIKDRTSRAPEQGKKGGRIFGVRDDEDSAFAPLEFKSVQHPPDRATETQSMLKKPQPQAGESTSGFTPLNLVQQGSPVDRGAGRVKGKILGRQENDDAVLPASGFQAFPPRQVEADVPRVNRFTSSRFEEEDPGTRKFSPPPVEEERGPRLQRPAVPQESSVRSFDLFRKKPAEGDSYQAPATKFLDENHLAITKIVEEKLFDFCAVETPPAPGLSRPSPSPTREVPDRDYSFDESTRREQFSREKAAGEAFQSLPRQHGDFNAYEAGTKKVVDFLAHAEEEPSPPSLAGEVKKSRIREDSFRSRISHHMERMKGGSDEEELSPPTAQPEQAAHRPAIVYPGDGRNTGSAPMKPMPASPERERAAPPYLPYDSMHDEMQQGRSHPLAPEPYYPAPYQEPPVVEPPAWSGFRQESPPGLFPAFPEEVNPSSGKGSSNASTPFDELVAHWRPALPVQDTPPADIPEQAVSVEEEPEGRDAVRKPSHQKPFTAPQEEPRPLFRRWRAKEDSSQRKNQAPQGGTSARDASTRGTPVKDATSDTTRGTPAREVPATDAVQRASAPGTIPEKEVTPRGSAAAPIRGIPQAGGPLQGQRVQSGPPPPVTVREPDKPHRVEQERRLFQEVWEIIVIKGPKSEEGRRYSITRESVTVGKGMNNDFVIADELLENTHIRIFLQDNRLFLQKLMKAQPIFINGKMLATNVGKAIEHGDTVQISTKTRIQLARKL